MTCLLDQSSIGIHSCRVLIGRQPASVGILCSLAKLSAKAQKQPSALQKRSAAQAGSNESW
eukprot:8907536-Karenia_brevis.AAC.1